VTLMKKARIPDLTPASKRGERLSRQPSGATGTPGKPAPRGGGIKPRATSAKSGRRGQ